ncbi:MAG TPA: tetratricopeptide repeat protein, partial [Bryobacteraceae bacterium]|nr:tetratricopeptide repeat protein [Bryobacteraceae bacterium]
MRGIILIFVLSVAAAAAPGPIAVDYPEDGSIFPPEITPPTFLWRDASQAAAVWRIEIIFGDGRPAIHATSRGERMRTGPIDRDCVAETNEPPRLTPLQAEAHSWTPGAVLWNAIKRRSTAAPARVTISGLAGGKVVSRGRVRISTSRDPVGAPIFYRDVPLMPTATETGEIKPLAAEAVRLIQWRLRDIGQRQSRVVLENMPLCVNCHSFSRDGRTVGLDLDGLQNNRGMYALAPVAQQTAIQKQNVIQWSSARGRIPGKLRVGFMSQVSPDGEYVVTTINREAMEAKGAGEAPSNYFVANFKDYRFLQVFYPTRGILSWYSRKTGVLTPLAGADDPRYVQTAGMWSPDGKWLVFERAAAIEPNPPGAPQVRFANDPNERQIRFDLYRIPFNQGRGGVAEPVAGASANGMSNTFPKISPDGRWIVFVRCRNGQLMRPDSELYIVPAAGGEARRMRCNQAPMNSWHSFSPNGRWLVFSSKRRGPYTKMYLTHIDEQGNDSPAILIDDATASNRAVNLPEFVNLRPEELREIGGPVIEFYRSYDRALYLQKKGRYAESVAQWRRAIEAEPDEPTSRTNFGAALLALGRPREAAAEFEKAKELKLRKAVESAEHSAPPHNDLGAALLAQGRLAEAAEQFEKAIAIDAGFVAARVNLAAALRLQGRTAEALEQARRAVASEPGSAQAQHQLAAAFAARGERDEAIAAWRKALRADPNLAEAHAGLAAALEEGGSAVEALAEWHEVLRLRPKDVRVLRQAAWIMATCGDA